MNFSLPNESKCRDIDCDLLQYLLLLHLQTPLDTLETPLNACDVPSFMSSDDHLNYFCFLGVVRIVLVFRSNSRFHQYFLAFSTTRTPL